MTDEIQQEMKLHKFSDFAVIHRKLEGDRVKDITEILNKELIFTAFNVCKSKVQGCDKYMTIQFQETKNSPYRVVFTSSLILMDQFLEYSDKLPFIATIKKVNRYLTLT